MKSKFKKIQAGPAEIIMVADSRDRVAIFNAVLQRNFYLSTKIRQEKRGDQARG
jgi:hypothetical protein